MKTQHSQKNQTKTKQNQKQIPGLILGEGPRKTSFPKAQQVTQTMVQVWEPLVLTTTNQSLSTDYMGYCE